MIGIQTLTRLPVVTVDRESIGLNHSASTR